MSAADSKNNMTARVTQLQGRFGPYPKYKASGAEWIGKVPEEWAVGNIRNFAFMRTGHTPSRSEESYWEDCIIPWFTLADVWQLRDEKRTYLGETTGCISKLGLANSAAELLPAGTVVFSRTASIGFSGIMPIPMATSQDFWNWIPGKKIESRFLLYVFRSMHQEFERMTMGSTHKTIYQPDAASIFICVPTIDEQHTIANFLDRETARIDSLVDKNRTLTERLKEKRAALISRIVTRGLPPNEARSAGFDPNPKFKDSGVEWLGEVPEHWAFPPLYMRYKIDLGKMLNEERMTRAFLVPYLRNVDIQWNRINTVNLPEMDIGPWEKDRYTVKPGDLLVCEGGEVGRSAIVDAATSGLGFQKALHRLSPINDEESPRYMYYILCHTSNWGVFIAEGNPNTIPHLTGEKLRLYRFPAPPILEQVAIAAYLNRETAKIDELVAKVETAIDRLKEYRSALISAAVTGKIDLREALN